MKDLMMIRLTILMTKRSFSLVTQIIQKCIPQDAKWWWTPKKTLRLLTTTISKPLMLATSVETLTATNPKIKALVTNSMPSLLIMKLPSIIVHLSLLIRTFWKKMNISQCLHSLKLILLWLVGWQELYDNNQLNRRLSLNQGRGFPHYYSRKKSSLILL